MIAEVTTAVVELVGCHIEKLKNIRMTLFKGTNVS